MKRRGRRLEAECKVPLPCPPDAIQGIAQCAPSPPDDLNNNARRIAVLEGIYAQLCDGWFERCEVARDAVGAEITRLRLSWRHS